MGYLRNRGFRSTVAMFLLCLCALGNVRMLQRVVRKHWRAEESPSGQFLDKLDSLRPLLASEGLPSSPTGTIGYLLDREHLADGVLHPDDRFHLVQYVLSPRLVERTTRHPLVIVDSDASDATPEIAVRENWTLIADARNGLKLFRTRCQQ